MKATLGNIWMAKDVFNSLAGMRFKAKTSYKLMKIIDQINHELDPYGKARQELFLKYGTQKDELITINPENTEAFKAEMTELDSTEIELKFAVTLDELESAELTPSQLYALEFMFDDVATSQ